MTKNTQKTRELKTVYSHMMPLPLYLFDIRCKCLLYLCCHG